MKRIILAALLLISFQQYAVAQADSVIHDTVTHRYERFYYQSWYDTCPFFLDSNMTLYDRNYDIFGNKFYTPTPIAVKGLAAMVRRDEDLTPINTAFEWLYSPDNGHMPEYLALWQDSNRLFHLATDSVRVDTVIPRVIHIPLSGRDSSLFALCLLYEVFFDKPVIVDSTFFISGTGHSNKGVYSEDFHDVFIYYKRWHYASIADTRHLNIENMTNYCHNQSPQCIIYYSGGHQMINDREWGPFFAIADFYNLTVESCDTALGSVNGGGRFSDQTSVTFSATPEPGYFFRQWNDGNTDNPRTVFLTQDTHFIAYFTDSIPLHVSARPDRTLYGRVTGGGTYWSGDTATLTAIPNDHYRFSHWNDGDTLNPRTVIVTQDTAFTAYFKWIDQHEGITTPDAKAPLFTLTPNPAHNSVTVTVNTQLPILNSQLSITLSDAAGRELLNSKVSTPNFQLPISQYPAGTYFVTLRTPDTASTQRLVIE